MRGVCNGSMPVNSQKNIEPRAAAPYKAPPSIVVVCEHVSFMALPSPMVVREHVSDMTQEDEADELIMLLFGVVPGLT